MVGIELKDVDVDFTIYQLAARSLKRAIYRSSVGGLVAPQADTGRTVIKALRKVSLDLRSGERIALLGHNGAGKTTLLRVLAGIYHPTAGSITASGRRVPLFDIGFGIDDEATGHENIVLRALVIGAKRPEIEEMRERVAEFSGLGPYLDLPVRTYSSGMMMRLQFAIATSIKGDVLLMDEWLATGDQEFSERANRRLLELVDQSHLLVLASHDLELLSRLCTRAIWLEAGQVRADGPTQDVIQQYTAAAA